MRASVTLNDETIQELFDVTNTTNITQAVSTAVNEYSRRRRLERCRALRGEVEITSNGEIEAAEMGEPGRDKHFEHVEGRERISRRGA